MRLAVVLALSFLLCVSSSCAAQRAPKHERESSEKERPVADSRSFMELFTKLERGWTEAAQKKDKDALEAVLAPEFILQTSDNPENPIPRADWIEHTLASDGIGSFSQRTMAIRAFIGVAVVSFVQSQTENVNGKGRTANYFIVDLWEVNQDKWQLAARYIDLVSDSQRADKEAKLSGY